MVENTIQLTSNPLQITVIFVAYGVVSELFQITSFSYIVISLNFLCLLHHIAMVTFIVYAGSSATKEAAKTKICIGKLMNESHLNDSEKINFLYFMSQLCSRNLHLENALFKINWNVLLTVRIKNF